MITLLFYVLTLGAGRERDRDRDRDRHRFVAPPIYVLIGCFLYVPLPEMELATLARNFVT